MGDTPASIDLAREMALKLACHTCMIYLELAGIREGGWEKIFSLKPRDTVLQISL